MLPVQIGGRVGRGRRRPVATLIADRLDRIACRVEDVAWPSPRWRKDPVGFAREVLGTVLWTKQRELVESIRDHRNTTCRSGHKCGKTTALAVAALWFYASFEDARVLMTAVKASQVDEAMWREVRRLYKRAKKRGYDLGGVLGEKANYGLRADDGRQIWGMTARDGEGLAGFSGPNILLLVDEASGVKDLFFEVLGTSLAGDGGTVRKCYISNPTKTTGEFYRSHTVNKSLFNCIHISSEDSPNAHGVALDENGKPVFPGLAGETWIAERLQEYGDREAFAYRVRVRGEFVHDKDGKIISLNAITTAEERWDETPEEGDLQLGIDSAGDGVLGDETVIAVRLGKKIVTVLPWRGITEEAIVAHAIATLKTHRHKTKTKPRIAVDVEGGIGTRVYAKLQVAVSGVGFDVDLVPVRSGKKFWGSPDYDMVRDGLWGQAREWIVAGGALPTDAKLSQDLNAPSWVKDKNGRYVATDKKQLKKELGRSPDRGDAVCLAIWKYADVEIANPDEKSATGNGPELYETPAAVDAYELDGVGGDPVYG